MKRIAALTLVLLLLALPVCAETIVVDLETATTEQLTEWIDTLTARRLALTGVTEKTLSPGVYTVGRDLAAGEYRLTVDDTVDSAFIYVYASGAEAWYDYKHFYRSGATTACPKSASLPLRTATVSTFRAHPSSFCPIPADLFPSKRHAPPRMSFLRFWPRFLSKTAFRKICICKICSFFEKSGCKPKMLRI